ncbi:MAG: ABC transporter permease [Clostridia bacterium]|nr:ABC transporter permease [Clostridia bacterium]
MFAIYKKELRSFFITPIGYIYTGAFLGLAALICCYTTLLSTSYDTTSYFTVMMFAMGILIPLLTMRLFAEEKKLRTEQLLLTAPVTITGMVMGKFLAALTVFGGSLLTSCINFIPIYAVANAERAGQSYEYYHIGPVTGQLIGNLVGLLLIGAAFIALGTFISALTENQLAAAVITISIIALMLGLGLINSLIDVYWIRAVLSWISIYSRFGNFQNGLFDFAAILYYASICFIFVFLTIRVYEKRRWN